MKVLLVEDEYQLRALEKRMLHNLGHESVPCESAEKALELLKTEKFSMIMLDMVLPGMSGLEFSRKLRSQPGGDIPYILAVTSWTEEQLKLILEAGVNDYIQKPIDITLFNIRIRIAEQFINNMQQRLQMQEQMRAMVTQDVLESTLNGFIRVVTNVLSLVAPTVFGRAMRVARIVRDFAPQVNLADSWELSAAAMLSQIGCVTIPKDILEKALADTTFTDAEQEMFLSHAESGSDLISNVPRMEKVASIIAYQEKNFDGSGHPQDDTKGDDIPVASRILKIALDLDTLFSKNMSRTEAFAELKSRTGWYDPKLLDIFADSTAHPRGAARRVWVNQLEDGMIFAEDVRSKTDTLLIMKGHEVTSSVRKQLSNFSKNFHIQQPIEVYIPSHLNI